MSGSVWQPCSLDGPYPVNMVSAGVDIDGEIIYAGRAYHEEDCIPAKVIPEKKIVSICYGGKEFLKKDFEVLRTGKFVWEKAAKGAVPEGAIKIGTTADGESLYTGRVLYEGTLTLGKVQPSHRCLHIPFNGVEIRIHEYEVLCFK